ncbi:MAG: nitrite/sulfite reductase [Candidatus Omnitrophica bacterium]|nr:nitrite/sulfite reductase [Candidatus Omnitrophota bacterium]
METSSDNPIAQAELDRLDRDLRRFADGKLDAELFKKIRLQFGIYSLRGQATRHMVRVRIPLGVVTAGQLLGLAGVVEEFTRPKLAHITTRQDLQIYGVEISRLVALLARLNNLGLTTREASGNVVRNVTLCPFAGIASDEPFDITPYAQGVSDYLLRNPLTQLLPRKVKIAFEGCSEDHARTSIHDIGVAAALKNGHEGFRIYAGGGLGSTPKAGHLIESWTPPAKLLPTLEAVLRLFERLGDREIRSKARLKFLVEKLGAEEFCKRVREERQVVWATQSGYALKALEAAPPEEKPPAPLTARAHLSDSDSFSRWGATNLVLQKQPGFAAVTARIPFGDITPEQLKGISELARRHAGGARLTNTQNILLRFVPTSHLLQVYEGLKGLALSESGAGRLADITRCPGADSCLSAITRPKGLAQEFERLFHNGLSPWAHERLSIKISGCPNSCGHHHIADIGFFGVALKVGQRHVPCYQILVGGRTAVGQATFGQRLARVPAQRAPEAIKRIVTYYFEQRQPEETFAAFVDRVGLAPLQAVVQDLTDHTDAARDPTLFVDLGTTEPFELEAGKGECAE